MMRRGEDGKFLSIAGREERSVFCHGIKGSILSGSIPFPCKMPQRFKSPIMIILSQIASYTHHILVLQVLHKE